MKMACTNNIAPSVHGEVLYLFDWHLCMATSEPLITSETHMQVSDTVRTGMSKNLSLHYFSFKDVGMK